MLISENFQKFDNVARFLTYLYIAGEQNEVVTVTNAAGTRLELYMDSELNTYVNVQGGDKRISWDCTLENMLGCIENLKEQPPIVTSSKFASRWDEIFFEAGAARALDRMANMK